MEKFIIQGGVPLTGTVAVGGSKNAALPILAATLLIDGRVTLHNLPHLDDIDGFLEAMVALGSRFEWIGSNSCMIDNTHLNFAAIETDYAKKMRATLLFLGPMLVRFKHGHITTPGGCMLGKRSMDSHIEAMKNLGARVLKLDVDNIELEMDQIVGNLNFTMKEVSVTATENALMCAFGAESLVGISACSVEPHVINLVEFLRMAGAKIDISPANSMMIVPPKVVERDFEFTICPDYIEAGTLAVAAIATKGDVLIKNFPIYDLDTFFAYLDEMGVNYQIIKDDSAVRFTPTEKLLPIKKLQTSIHPMFPTDLQALMGVLMTQADGISKIFETMFENRFNYLAELETMGAHTEILNPHQAIIVGPTRLVGREVSSWDLRAGAAMVIAALIAKGESKVFRVVYIDRGYEHLEQKLRSLGALIKRSNTRPDDNE